MKRFAGFVRFDDTLSHAPTACRERFPGTLSDCIVNFSVVLDDMSAVVIENRGPQLLAVASTFVAAATLALVLRIYVRSWVVKSFGVDDWTMTFAGISFILFCACAITGVHYGTGRHFEDLQDDDRSEAMKVGRHHSVGKLTWATN